MTSRKILSLLPATLLWVPLIFFALLLSHNAMLYFTHGGEYGILPEKRAAQQDMVWQAAFYVHLPAGVLCLLSPIFLFTRRFFNGALSLHKAVGKLYVWITLIVVCPTGMYLALYAKGGLITQVGFLLQGILLAVFTYRGYRSIGRGDKVEHFHNMIRSYATACVVLSFRIFHILFFLLNVPYLDNYAISQWLGLFGNLLLAELIVLSTILKSQRSRPLKSLPL